ALFEADEKAAAWVRKHSKKEAKPVCADPGASYEKVMDFYVSKLTPQVSKPHTVDNVSSVETLKGRKVDQVYIGTCTNARLEDLEIAAGILKNKTIHPDVKLIIAPASKGIYMDAMAKGLLEIFIKSGGVILPPGCGPCVGTHAGVPADGDTVISTANRNFKGRMGNPKAFIYLGSPATCAASALEGEIADPRKYCR
ncbi:MAG: aconitase family protein, partial [Candidatus Omnitrophota bacterium]